MTGETDISWTDPVQHERDIAAERAVRFVREALAPFAGNSYGDLILGADRAAVIAVAALRNAGLLATNIAPNLTCGEANPATGAVCELGPHPDRPEHYGPNPQGRRATWRGSTDFGS